MKRPYLTIIRGLPGMGKSTRARKYAEESGALLVEPDMFLTNHGEYIYDVVRYRQACDHALSCVRIAAITGSDVIYADVLPKREDVEAIIREYNTLAPTGGNALVNVIEMGAIDAALSFQRNRHNVKREDVEKMALEWEPWDTYEEEES